jgi:hypothetical protein
MGRRDRGPEQDGWTEESDDEDKEEMELSEEYQEADEGFEDEAASRTPRPSATPRLLARRLIEQAREQRELSKSLADFDDYVI